MTFPLLILDPISRGNLPHLPLVTFFLPATWISSEGCIGGVCAFEVVLSPVRLYCLGNDVLHRLTHFLSKGPYGSMSLLRDTDSASGTSRRITT